MQINWEAIEAVQLGLTVEEALLIEGIPTDDFWDGCRVPSVKKKRNRIHKHKLEHLRQTLAKMSNREVGKEIITHLCKKRVHQLIKNEDRPKRIPSAEYPYIVRTEKAEIPAEIEHVQIIRMRRARLIESGYILPRNYII